MLFPGITTFILYYFFKLKKFDVDEHWVPFKLDVEVEMPDEIDLVRLARLVRLVILVRII